MKKMLSIAVAAFACASASAQTSNFAGFSASANLNTASVTTKFVTADATLDGIGQQSWNGSVQAAYGFVTSPNGIVSLGMSYSLGNVKGGTITESSGSTEIRLENVYSLYIEPGFLLNDKTLAYGKLSYESAKGVISAAGEASKSVSGTGFGLGIRTMLDKNSFIQVEFKQAGYGSVDLTTDVSAKPISTIGSIGFGVKF